MPLLQVAHFLNDSMVNLLFYCHIIFVTSYEKLSDSLTLEVQVAWKISTFNTIDGSMKMLKYS